MCNLWKCPEVFEYQFEAIGVMRGVMAIINTSLALLDYLYIIKMSQF